jgi:hypothetical protein
MFSYFRSINIYLIINPRNRYKSAVLYMETSWQSYSTNKLDAMTVWSHEEWQTFATLRFLWLFIRNPTHPRFQCSSLIALTNQSEHMKIMSRGCNYFRGIEIRVHYEVSNNMGPNYWLLSYTPKWQRDVD